MINSVLITDKELLEDELSNNAKDANNLIKDKKPVPDDLWVSKRCSINFRHVPYLGLPGND